MRCQRCFYLVQTLYQRNIDEEQVCGGCFYYLYERRPTVMDQVEVLTLPPNKRKVATVEVFGDWSL